MSPAPARRTSVSASSATTNALLSRWCQPARQPGDAVALSAPLTSVFHASHAGTAPNTTPVATARRKLKASTRASSPIRSGLGSSSRCAADDEADAPHGRRERDGAAERGEHDVLGEELADQTPAPAAERGADRHLARPPAAAREQQVRDVRAGDQQDEADRAEQERQQRARVLDVRVARRLQADGVARVVGVLASLLGGDRRRSAAARRRGSGPAPAGRSRRASASRARRRRSKSAIGT